MIRSLLVIAAIFLTVSMMVPSYAACSAMVFRILEHVMPDNDTRAFISYSEKTQMESLVLEVTFHGNAQEFGMIMPLPTKPFLEESSPALFDELERMTRDYSIINDQLLFDTKDSIVYRESTVIVIETKDVGDYSTTTFTATNTDDLLTWLKDNDFTYTDADFENFDYYVQKGGYFFVAFKVNMDKITLGPNGEYDGRLQPIEFTFKTEEPMLPFRIMASDMEEMNLTLYVLGNFLYYVPGISVQFADQIIVHKSLLKNDGESADSLIESKNLGVQVVSTELLRYEPNEKWLTKMDMDFDPKRVKENLLLSKALEIISPISPENPTKINPRDTPTDSGIIESTITSSILLDDFADTISPLKQRNLGIPNDSIECKTKHLLVDRTYQGSACIKESSIDMILEMYGNNWSISNIRSDEIARIG